MQSDSRDFTLNFGFTEVQKNITTVTLILWQSLASSLLIQNSQ